jgi:hypothetical protein
MKTHREEPSGDADKEESSASGDDCCQEGNGNLQEQIDDLQAEVARLTERKQRYKEGKQQLKEDNQQLKEDNQQLQQELKDANTLRREEQRTYLSFCIMCSKQADPVMPSTKAITDDWAPNFPTITISEISEAMKAEFTKPPEPEDCDKVPDLKTFDLAKHLLPALKRIARALPGVSSTGKRKEVEALIFAHLESHKEYTQEMLDEYALDPKVAPGAPLPQGAAARIQSKEPESKDVVASVESKDVVAPVESKDDVAPEIIYKDNIRALLDSGCQPVMCLNRLLDMYHDPVARGKIRELYKAGAFRDLLKLPAAAPEGAEEGSEDKAAGAQDIKLDLSSLFA